MSYPFVFKEFTIHQENTAMKVGTDGVLLGAWCSIESFPDTILDIGSGAGFPGMILAIMGNNNVCLIESDQKKCIFLREVARLTNTKVKIYNCRIEELEYMEPELIISRALAPLSKLIEYVDNHMNKNIEENKVTPKLLFLKGKNYNSEIYDLLKIRKIEIDIFSSITDEFGKVLYIKNINLC